MIPYNGKKLLSKRELDWCEKYMKALDDYTYENIEYVFIAIHTARQKLDKYVESLFKKMFEKSYPPSSAVAREWNMVETISLERLPEDGTSQKPAIIRKIHELLDDGYQVKTGYMSTRSRGYHTHCIFYKHTEIKV